MIPVFRLGIPALIGSVWLSGRCMLIAVRSHIYSTAELQLKKSGCRNSIGCSLGRDGSKFYKRYRGTGQREM